MSLIKTVHGSIDLGMIDDLPIGSPLETPLHPKRSRTHFSSDCGGGIWTAGTDTNNGTSTDTPTHQDIETVTTPRSNPWPRRPCLRDKKKNHLTDYGSEEELEEEENDVQEEPMIPRSLRLFFESDEDTDRESQAAERTNETVVHPEAAVEGDVNGPTSLYEFKWDSCPVPPIELELRREKFVGSSGPTIDPPTNPYDIFIRIWDRAIVEQIVAETNQYATQLLNTNLMRPNSLISYWVDTNVDEIYCFLAIVLAMGVIIKSDLEDYWQEENDIFQTPGFGQIMSIRRFQLLSRFIHFNNNTDISSLSPSEAKTHKVIPIINHLNLKFTQFYDLGPNVALDESLTQWKGWLQIKQCIPNQKAAVGIKTYEVCDSHTGYLWRFEVHAGSQMPNEKGIINGSIPNLVLRLLQGLEHTGRTIWMDNYYNSPALARVLKTLGLDCVGTLCTNRKYVPAQIVNLKKEDMRVGQVCGYTSGDVDLMVWRDQNRVAMISTYHGVTVSDNKPIVVRDYNMCMRGVDRKDQMLSMYPVERKMTKIWYKQFFQRLLNASVLNAYIIHKHFHRNVDHKKFRVRLVKEILKNHRVDRSHPPPPPAQLGEFRTKLPAYITDHFPEELPSRQRQSCVVCKIRRTHHCCKACNAVLCFGSKYNCYKKYHS